MTHKGRKSTEFEYFDAGSLREAVSLLDRYGEEARVMAGGTDLLVDVKQNAFTPKILVNLKRIPNLSYIEYREKDGLRIGPLTRLRDLETSSVIQKGFSILARSAHEVGTIQLRNVGTLGGNLCQNVKCCYYNLSHVSLFLRRSMTPCWKRGGSICHALKTDSLHHSIIGKAVDGCIAPTPSDMAPPLMALGATVKITGPDGERTLPLEEFFVGAGKTALRFDEVLTEIRVADIPPRVGGYFLKYARGTGDYAVVNLAVTVTVKGNDTCEDVRIVFGGLAPAPFRAKEAEDKLRGRRISADAIEEAASSALKGARTLGPKGVFKLKKAESMMKDAFARVLEGARSRGS